MCEAFHRPVKFLRAPAQQIQTSSRLLPAMACSTEIIAPGLSSLISNRRVP
jgi:hypothetical protein